MGGMHYRRLQTQSRGRSPSRKCARRNKYGTVREICQSTTKTGTAKFLVSGCLNPAFMSPRYRIVFHGHILPGFEPLLVRHCFQSAYHLPPETAKLIFSGKKIVLQRNVTPDGLPNYYNYLRDLGLKVSVERELRYPVLPEPAYTLQRPMATDSLGLNQRHILEEIELLRHEVSAGLDPVSAPMIVARDHHETCPRCGEVQPHRTLCRICGIDMPRLRAVQRAHAEETHARLATHRVVADGSPANLRLASRIGRLHYLTFVCISLLVLAAGGAASLWLKIPLPLVVALAPAAVIALFGTVLRLHDLNASGWLAVTVLIPYAGLIVGIALLAVPGTDGSNRFGTSQRPLRWYRATGFLLIALGAALLLARVLATDTNEPRALTSILETLSAEMRP